MLFHRERTQIPDKKLSPAARRAFSDALEAWFAGDFQRCLEICDTIVPRDAVTATQVRLLRARALLRLKRAAEALELLRDRASLHPTPDVVATALMLRAAAHARLGDYALALATLEDARQVPGEVHPTIRSEIALTAGLACYGMRSLDEAERALDLVAPDSDIVYARALEYRAGIAWVRADAERAANLFYAALAHLDTCRHYDRFLEANVLMGLGLIACERFDAAGWARVAERADRFDWSGLERVRFALALCASVFAEAAGDVRAAMRSAVDAELLATDGLQRAQVCLRRAEIARGSGDTHAHLGFVDEAEVLLQRAARESLAGDAVYIPLTLAEEFALAGDRAKAEAALALYREIERPLGMLALSSDVRRRGFERIAEAHVLALRGDERPALRAFLDAFESFEQVGYRRRAAVAALRLMELTTSPQYRQYALDATAGSASTFWMRRKATGQERGIDALFALLTPLERDTLRLVVRGLSNPQIAREQNRSRYTVRNMLSQLFQVFGVQDRRQLAALCHRLDRGDALVHPPQ